MLIKVYNTLLSKYTTKYVVIVVVSIPPFIIIERSPNRLTCYADNLSLHVASEIITLAGSVHRSRTVIGVYSSVQVKMCVVSCTCMLQRGQSCAVWFEALTLCRYDVRKGDLFVLSCARVRRCALVSVVLLCLLLQLQCVVVCCFLCC